MLTNTVAIIGPPAVGKTSLTMHLGKERGHRTFRLREHIPQPILAATASDAARMGWIDDFTVIGSVHQYFEGVVRGSATHTVLLDNFPGTYTQVNLFLSLMRQLAPDCAISAVELVADPLVLRSRVTGRRVCQFCERDPLCDPRLPVAVDPHDPEHCARCSHPLEPRQGDDPIVYRARLKRYRELADGIRRAFTEAGVGMPRLNTNRPLEAIAAELSSSLTARSTPS